jgi:hypothetical protein
VVVTSVIWFVRTHLNQILAYLLNFGNEEARDLAFVGNKLGLSGKDFATYIIGQILADIISAVIIFVVAGLLGLLLIGKFRQGLQFPTHDISIEGRLTSETEEDNVTTYYVKVSNENGDEPAPECRARITFNGLTWRDIVDIPSLKTQYSSTSKEFRSTNYFRTTKLSFRLPWRNGGDRQTILSGDYELLPVLKLIPATEDVPEHFEVPYIVAGPVFQIGVGVCLRPLHEYGEIRIIPSRGRFRRMRFSVEQDSGGEWVVAT